MVTFHRTNNLSTILLFTTADTTATTRSSVPSCTTIRPVLSKVPLTNPTAVLALPAVTILMDTR